MEDKEENKGTTLEPHWKYVEKIVALLEKSLTPEARVEHNAFLPVIGRPNRGSRQCDVVITYGEQPRSITAIVEVQKREKKPDINTFNGWVEKMREVGAQLLICVSALGYPDSIIDKVANQLGPIVRLLTLKDIEEANLPGIILPPFLVHRNPQFSIKSIGNMELGSPSLMDNLQLNLNSGEKVFRWDDDVIRLCLNDLVGETLNRGATQAFASQDLYEPKSYSLEMLFDSTKRNLWIYIGENRFKVLNLSIAVQVETRATKIPLIVSAYRQEFEDGVLAWVAFSKRIVDGKEISVEVVFKPNKDGILHLAMVRQQGIESLRIFLSPDKEVINRLQAQFFDDENK